jgi:hypothetical protein
VPTSRWAGERPTLSLFIGTSITLFIVEGGAWLGAAGRNQMDEDACQRVAGQEFTDLAKTFNQNNAQENE